MTATTLVTNGVHSAGKRSLRSPRCRACLPSAAGRVSSQSNGPAVTATGWPMSIVTG